jgi:hypothetical protein
MLVARTPMSSTTADLKGHMYEVVGLWTSSFQKTADVRGYTRSEPPATISVAALLELARWCQQRRCSQLGGDPCPTPIAALPPPVVADGQHSPHPAPATLDSPECPTTKGTRPTAQRVAQSLSSPTPDTGADQ